MTETTGGDRVAVAVAVVSYDERELLARCLRSLEPDHESGLAEVWVVDNASSDGSPDMVRRDFPWAHLIANEENVGYGAAVNVVAERSEAPFIAPCNQDLELEEGALARMVATARDRPRAGIVAPRLVGADGVMQHSVHPFPTVALTLLYNLGLHRLSPRLADRLCLEGYWRPERAREVPWALAALLVVRREAFEGAGGFDPGMWLHAEDLDLAWRLREAGWRTFYESAAVVRHAGSVSTRKAFGTNLEARWMSASYAWMARRRGVAVARTVVTLNLGGAAARALALRPLAVLAPERFGARYESHARWSRIHAAGLRSRERLTRPH